MPIKLKSAGGGDFTVDAASSASNFTHTLPAATGTLVNTGSTAQVSQSMLASNVANTGPAFSVFLGTTNQSITNSTWTKVNFNSTEYDTASAFDITTNDRFQPTVAGYYHINAGISFGTSANTLIGIAIYKWNGSTSVEYKRGFSGNPGVSAASVSALVYLNGTTDFLEIWGITTATTPIFFAGSNLTWCTGYLARAA